MIQRRPLTLLFTLLSAACATAADPLQPLSHSAALRIVRNNVLQAPSCTITEVQITEQSIAVQFIGRWSPSPGFVETDRNALHVSRDHSVSEHAWAGLAQRFRSQQASV
jgi:hypothetical protein